MSHAQSTADSPATAGTPQPRVLLLAAHLKDYWVSPYGQTRITHSLTFKDIGLFSRASSNLVRYFVLACKGWLIAQDYDVVVCVDRHLALWMGLLNRLLGLKTNVIAHQFILPDMNDSQRRPFAVYWDRLSSSGLAHVIVNSKLEAEIYHQRLVPSVTTTYIPLAAPDSVFEIKAQPAPMPTVFSGGSTERDYATLFKAVAADKYQVDVITASIQSLPPRPWPENVRVAFAWPFQEFLTRMAAAWVVVVPLHNVSRAAGQATILYAQAMGKAVVASDIPAIRDYIEHEVNGLLVPVGDPDRLRAAIRLLLDDEPFRQQLERTARARVHTFKTYDHSIGQVLTSVITPPANGP